MEKLTQIVELSKVLKDNKAEDIVCFDTSKSSNVANFFILATANSTVHIKSLIEFVCEEVEKSGSFNVLNKEGLNTSKWHVLDLGDGLVHIFTKEEREKYNLEKLLGENGNVYSFEKLIKLEEKCKKKIEKNIVKEDEIEKDDERKKKKINKALSKINKKGKKD